MIDLFLFAQLTWCFVWISKRRLQSALLYAGGIVSAGYVAWATVDWVEKWIATPSDTAFLWLQNHLTASAEDVAILSRFIPPEPVTASLNQSSWISLHVARGLIFCVITFAVFATFAIVLYLRSAIWDTTDADRVGLSELRSVGSNMIALITSIYLCVLLMMLLSYLAWIQPFHAMAPLVARSLGFRLYSMFLY